MYLGLTFVHRVFCNSLSINAFKNSLFPNVKRTCTQHISALATGPVGFVWLQQLHFAQAGPAAPAGSFETPFHRSPKHLYTIIGLPDPSEAHYVVKMITIFFAHPHSVRSVAHFHPLPKSSLHPSQHPSAFSGTFCCKDDYHFFRAPSFCAFCGTFFSNTQIIFSPRSVFQLLLWHFPL
jgi:hypothetical protein